MDGHSIVAKGMFSKQTDMARFVGMKVILKATGAIGKIDSTFGQSGKFKVIFPRGIGEEQKQNAADATAASSAAGNQRGGKRKGKGKGKKLKSE
jgi:selenocysteine-specific elongation factor